MLCSTTSSSQIRSEIASILISNHLEFLECILDSPFGKEGGGAMTKSILDLLLEYHSLEQVELFLWRVVKKKIEKTKRVSSESSMKTLLRDNSWEILLFSSFLHHESKSYLLNVLQNPVLGALALFEKMESTLSKPSLYGQKLPAQLLVEKILHSILAKKDIIPLSTIRLCASLKKELDAVFHICPHSPTSPISSLLMSPITPILSTLEPHPSSSDVSLSFEISELLPASVDEFVNSATTLEPAPIPSKKTKKKKPHPPILQKFSASEQMISTFLFLRLFVPGVYYCFLPQTSHPPTVNLELH
ncbi:hypothetical protein HMI55_000070 [Coelomomyces lativittatus]|nr:hypothetical protein HMI55_000070 [Coelomomyces lativittatus]